MVSWEFFSEDLIATILNYLNYQDLFCRKKVNPLQNNSYSNTKTFKKCQNRKRNNKQFFEAILGKKRIGKHPNYFVFSK